MRQFIISPDETIATSLERLNRLGHPAMTLIVVDNEMHPVGTLTDGDIRRALLSGLSLQAPVNQAMNTTFTVADTDNARMLSFASLRDRGIKLLPVVDSDRRLAETVDLTTRLAALNIPALIMAGGKGERLRPATLTTPKPLLTLAGKPIIDYSIDHLKRYGVNDITVSTRYLADKIKEHFDGTDIKCITEASPLGTIGAVSLMGGIKSDTLLVMNSDILTDIALDEMYRHHINTHAAITVGAIPYSVSVPYAILTTDSTRVTGLDEKPTYSFYANAGIYLLNTQALSIVKYNERLDATDLIEQAINSDLMVTYFPLSGRWIDIGTPADFRHAEELLKQTPVYN